MSQATLIKGHEWKGDEQVNALRVKGRISLSEDLYDSDPATVHVLVKNKSQMITGYARLFFPKRWAQFHHPMKTALGDKVNGKAQNCIVLQQLLATVHGSYLEVLHEALKNYTSCDFVIGTFTSFVLRTVLKNTPTIVTTDRSGDRIDFYIPTVTLLHEIEHISIKNTLPSKWYMTKLDLEEYVSSESLVELIKQPYVVVLYTKKGIDDAVARKHMVGYKSHFEQVKYVIGNLDEMENIKSYTQLPTVVFYRRGIKVKIVEHYKEADYIYHSLYAAKTDIKEVFSDTELYEEIEKRAFSGVLFIDGLDPNLAFLRFNFEKLYHFDPPIWHVKQYCLSLIKNKKIMIAYRDKWEGKCKYAQKNQPMVCVGYEEMSEELVVFGFDNIVRYLEDTLGEEDVTPVHFQKPLFLE